MEAELRQLPKGLRARLEGSCVIGRSPEADIQVFSSRVSREHAMIRQQANGFWIYDLDSANGTLVNDREIVQPESLKHGDVITMADITFVFHVPDEDVTDNGEEEMDEPLATVIGVRKVPMILLVTDIIGFSSFSGKLSEEQLAELLNSWYADCQSIMNEYGGTIDKFMGDGMFGYWKSTTPSARSQALEAAKRLVAGPRELPEPLVELLEQQDITIQCGVGLHIGDTAVGSVTRGTRTALGDAVNLTFRIEALTREVDRPILVTSSFLDRWSAGSGFFEGLGAMPVKGFEDPVEIYALKE